MKKIFLVLVLFFTFFTIISCGENNEESDNKDKIEDSNNGDENPIDKEENEQNPEDKENNEDKPEDKVYTFSVEIFNNKIISGFGQLEAFYNLTSNQNDKGILNILKDNKDNITVKYDGLNYVYSFNEEEEITYKYFKYENVYAGLEDSGYSYTIEYYLANNEDVSYYHVKYKNNNELDVISLLTIYVEKTISFKESRFENLNNAFIYEDGSGYQKAISITNNEMLNENPYLLFAFFDSLEWMSIKGNPEAENIDFDDRYFHLCFNTRRVLENDKSGFMSKYNSYILQYNLNFKDGIIVAGYPQSAKDFHVVYAKFDVDVFRNLLKAINVDVPDYTSPVIVNYANELYDELGKLTVFDFRYGSYLIKSHIYSPNVVLNPTLDDLGEGKPINLLPSVCNILKVSDDIYDYINNNYKELLKGTFLENKELINCAGIKWKNSNDDYLFDFLILVLDDRSIIQVEGIVENNYQTADLLQNNLFYLEELGYAKIYSNWTNSNYNKASIDLFKESMSKLDKEPYKTPNDFLDTESAKALDDWVIGYGSGIFSFIYLSEGGYILHAQSGRRNVILSLIVLDENGIVTDIIRDVSKFSDYLE